MLLSSDLPRIAVFSALGTRLASTQHIQYLIFGRIPESLERDPFKTIIRGLSNTFGADISSSLASSAGEALSSVPRYLAVAQRAQGCDEHWMKEPESGLDEFGLW